MRMFCFFLNILKDVTVLTSIWINTTACRRPQIPKSSPRSRILKQIWRLHFYTTNLWQTSRSLLKCKRWISAYVLTVWTFCDHHVYLYKACCFCYCCCFFPPQQWCFTSAEHPFHLPHLKVALDYCVFPNNHKNILQKVRTWPLSVFPPAVIFRAVLWSTAWTPAPVTEDRWPFSWGIMADRNQIISCWHRDQKTLSLVCWNGLFQFHTEIKLCTAKVISWLFTWQWCTWKYTQAANTQLTVGLKSVHL